MASSAYAGRQRHVQSRRMVCLIVTRSCGGPWTPVYAAPPRSCGARRVLSLSKLPILGAAFWLCRNPFSFRPFISSFRWRVESRLQSPQFPYSSHGCFVCKACRLVESEGPCARFPAAFVGCSRRQLVGCRRCRDTVVRRGVRRQISRCRGHGRRGLRWTLWRLNALRYRELV